MRSFFSRRVIPGVAAILAAAPAVADIQLEVVAGPNPARQGETLDVEVTVTNDGPFDLTVVTVEVTTPDHLNTLFDSVIIGGDCTGTTCTVGELISFEIDSLPAGKGLTFSVPMQVSGVAADGAMITIDVEAIDDAVVEASSSTEVIVDPGREVELALAERRDPVAPGTAIEYTLTYGVLETSPGSIGAKLRLPIPAGTSLGAASAGGAEVDGGVEWTLGNLGPGTVGECSATLLVDGGADTGSIVVAEATYEDDGEANVVSYQCATRVQSEIPLELLVTASPDPTRPSETMDVEITVTNTGPFDRSGVEVTVKVPDHLNTLFDTVIDSGDCPSTTCDRQERVTFDVGTLPAGEGLTFTIPMQVFGTVLDGTVLSIEAEVTDSTGDLRESAASVAVAESREVELAIVALRDPVAAGEDIDYSLTYGVLETSGGAPAAMLRLPLPPGTTLVAASHGGVEVDGVVEWALGALNPGATGERTARVQVDGGADTGSIIRAQTTFDDGGSALDTVAHESAVRVQDDIPLELLVTASPDPARPLETMDVEITVTNSGDFDRSSVVVKVEIPHQLNTLFDVGVDGGDCPGTTCDDQERLTFDVGTLPAGEGLTFSVPMQIFGTVLDGTVVRIEAEVTDSTGELRESGANVAVDGVREYDLALVESDEPAAAGDGVTYTVTYGTIATDDGVADGRVSFIPPSGATVDFISDGGSLSDGIVEWSVGAMNPGDGGERIVGVTLGAAPNGSIVAANARFHDVNSPETEMRFEDAMRTAATSPLDVELTMRSVEAVGNQFLIDLSITNTSGIDRNDVVVKLEIPDHLVTLFDSTFDGDCPGTTCDVQEWATFAIPFLDAGETLSFEIVAQIFGTTIAGSVINFDAYATDPTGFLAYDGDALFVGTVFDASIGADTVVDVVDLLALLGAWGPCADADDCPGDFNGDGVVDTVDLLFLLGAWG